MDNLSTRATNGTCRRKEPTLVQKIWKLYYMIEREVMKYVKYLFYILVIWLFPTSFYLYYFKYGQYPWNSFWVALMFSISSALAGMAYWSHKEASPPNDPGYLDWEHFRTDSEI
jgi:hypothetical protein